MDAVMPGCNSIGRWFARGAALGAAAVCGALDYTHNLMQDEAFSLHTTDGGIARAARRAVEFEHQPPLYFVALAAWRRFDRSDPIDRNGTAGFARLLSTAAALLAAETMLRRRPAAAVAYTLHPFALTTATEARGYAVGTWLSAEILSSFTRRYLDGSDCRRARWRFIVASVLALYTQYYLGFVLAGCAGALVVRGDWRALRKLVIDGMIISAAFAPMAVNVPKQISSNSANQAVDVSWPAAAKTVATAITYFLLPHDWRSQDQRRLAAISLAAVSLALLALRSGSRAALRSPSLLVAAGTAVAFIVAQRAFGQPLILPRHAMPMYIPLLNAWADFLGSLTPAWAGVVAAGGVMSVVQRWSDGANVGDWRRVASFIAQHEEDDQPILVFQAEAVLPFRHYYHGRNRVVPIPRDLDFERYDLRGSVIVDAGDAQAAFRGARIGERAWLVTNHVTEYLSLNFGTEILEAHVAAQYDVEDDRAFLGTRVRRLRRRVS
jgi:hypothetical protein